METNSNERKILSELRTRLMRFCNCRERAYNMMRKKGYAVPDYSAKIASILFIRIHLQASESWPLAPHIRMISETLRKHIHTILPFEFHEQDRQRSYRKHILDVLRFCDDRMEKKQIRLFTNKPKAA
jgi:hypothetical protein